MLQKFIILFLFLSFISKIGISQTQTTKLLDSCKVILIETYKYDYSIKAIRLTTNDTITIVSDKVKAPRKSKAISINQNYLFDLTPLLDLDKTSAMPQGTFRLRAKDKRTLWTNGQHKKLIPYKASNLKGLCISSTDL
jgi:hypothetical protein